MKKLFLALLVLFSISFSSLIWEHKSTEGFSTKPLIFANSLLIGSDSGSLYLLNHLQGSLIWEKKLGGQIIQPVAIGSQVAVATKNGLLGLRSASGDASWEIDLSKTQNISRIINIDTDSTNIYVATDKGVYSLNLAGANVKRIYASAGISTPLSVGGNAIVFGEGQSLVRITPDGQVQWKADVGGTWLSKPLIDGAMIYVGGIDKGMHAILFGNGVKAWSYITNGWVVSTPTVSNGIIYFGSNDGSVYALDKTDGRLLWKTATPQAIQTKPELGIMGGQEAVFLGSTNGRTYALDRKSGDIVWSGRAGSMVSDTLFYQNFIYFGSQDRSVYAFSSERACSINTPAEGEIVRVKEVKVTGALVSQSASPKVDVQVNNGPWQAAMINGERWAFYVNPSNELNAGVNTIRCRVSDASGTETGSYTEIGIIRDPVALNSNLMVTTKGTLVEGKEFEIFVNDMDDGSPVERFSLSLNGISLNGSGSVNITVPGAGSYQLIVRKMGFSDAVLKLDIASSGINPAFIAIAVLFIAIAAWQAYIRFVKK